MAIGILSLSLGEGHEDHDHVIGTMTIGSSGLVDTNRFGPKWPVGHVIMIVKSLLWTEESK